LDLATTKGNQLKAKYQATTSQATTLLSHIEGDTSAWMWANNAQNGGRLRAALDTIMDDLTTGLKELLVHDLRNLRKSVGQDHLMVELANFFKLEPKLDALGKTTMQLLNMQKSRV
jgi:hypothetical protein